MALNEAASIRTNKAAGLLSEISFWFIILRQTLSGDLWLIGASVDGNTVNLLFI